jgi:hypothetical protein
LKNAAGLGLGAAYEKDLAAGPVPGAMQRPDGGDGGFSPLAVAIQDETAGATAERLLLEGVGVEVEDLLGEGDTVGHEAQGDAEVEVLFGGDEAMDFFFRVVAELVQQAAVDFECGGVADFLLGRAAGEITR